ncbi:MAG: hypothetical protein CFH34_00617 [Alphaproteobacteria bacterium MarineAlpha9_Bin4]|nr:MAG: hypothetical protein CFH34_00617 [Alphaproteobacteria bacterium MarineAlpha9_Bin4]|tara:strand:- start:1036 stop:1425 length:390 start_codon:yes stop_codon:yes gene_type:complete
MEFLLDNKLYLFLALIIFILLFKIWKDLEYKEIINKKIDDLSANSLNNSKEIESLLIEIGETTKRTEFVLEYLKRLDQNASRLADNIQGEQSMSKAIEMAREGKDHLEIVKETGLSNEEVEAIIHSHKE